MLRVISAASIFLLVLLGVHSFCLEKRVSPSSGGEVAAAASITAARSSVACDEPAFHTTSRRDFVSVSFSSLLVLLVDHTSANAAGNNISDSKTIAILFSAGGLGDVGRHAILAALSDSRVKHVKVFASSVNLRGLEAQNWKCGCKENHGEDLLSALRQSETTKTSPQIEMIEFDAAYSNSAQRQNLVENLRGVDAVLSCLGNRQPFLGERVAKRGTEVLVKAMEETEIKRLVMMSSMGLAEDEPCMEWRFEGKVMDIMFKTVCRREKGDLLAAENAVKRSDLNYLIVRPVGLGEDVVPAGKYFTQKKKYEDILGGNMAKMDCARLFVDEAIEPTMERQGIVVGSDPEGPYGGRGDQ